VQRPAVRYAQNAGISIAYQVFGEGDHDLVFVCGTMSHLELWWTDPLATAMLEGLASFSRVILFDKPGTGMSDPIPAAPTLEQRTADLVAVMDDVGSERAIIVGYSEGGLPATVLAATRPQRVEALVLLDAVLSMDWHEHLLVDRSVYDHAWSVLDEACRRWGEGFFAGALAPTWAAHPQMDELLGHIERTCMSPGMARSVLQGYHGMDATEAAASVHVPTLVLHVEDDPLLHPSVGRDSAARIEGAVFEALPGRDHMVWIDNSDTVPAAIQRFVAGRSTGVADAERILTTIVFTDIVESTSQLARSGDRRWRALLDDHDRRMDDLVAHLGGAIVKHTGDGRLVHFARPARAIRFATAMVEAARAVGLEIRAGIHTGECEVVPGDLRGMAVHLAARVAGAAAANEVLVTSTVRDLVVGSGLQFQDTGEHELKGAPGSWRLHRVAADRPGPLVGRGYDTDVRNEIAGAATPS
jgi:class 3 adenylate cyclase